MLILVIILELTFLWLFTRAVTSALYAATLILTRSRTLGVSVVTALLYPGTVLHELSHLLAATALGVKTGRIELTPEIPWRQLLEHKGFAMKTGSVDIERTDVLRRTLVGTAPLVTGVAAVSGIAIYLWPVMTAVGAAWKNGESALSLSYFALLLTYLIWAIGNTMYPSRADLSGSWQILTILALLIAAVFLAGFSATGYLPDLVLPSHPIFAPVAISLGIVLTLDLVIVAGCRVLVGVLIGMRRSW